MSLLTTATSTSISEWPRVYHNSYSKIVHKKSGVKPGKRVLFWISTLIIIFIIAEALVSEEDTPIIGDRGRSIFVGECPDPQIFDQRLQSCVIPFKFSDEFT